MNTHLNAYETLRAKNTKQEMPRLTTESLVENAMTHLPSVELTTCLFFSLSTQNEAKEFHRLFCDDILPIQKMSHHKTAV